MALDALGSSPDQAFFIGDSHHDIEAGRRAGVTTVAVTWGPFSREKLAASKPDHWLEEPRGIFELCRAAGCFCRVFGIRRRYAHLLP
jgi:pyrophosphatase PpaX